MNPPSNTASVTVDWLRWTTHWGTSTLPHTMLKASALRVASRAFPLGTNWKEAKARNGYNVALESIDCAGVTVSWSSSRADMGVSVDIPGSALSGLPLRECIALGVRPGCRVSRIDIAVDIPEYLSFAKMEEYIEAGKCNTKAKGWRFINSDTGRTIYIGSRSSEKYLRIYDKGSQMQTLTDWTRVELECKGEFARGVANHLNIEGLSNIPNIIRDFFDMPDYYLWHDWMASPTLPVGIPKAEKQTNTFKWLMETVAPALVKFISENPDLRDTFMMRLETLGWFGSGGGEADIFDGRGDFD